MSSRAEADTVSPNAAAPCFMTVQCQKMVALAPPSATPVPPLIRVSVPRVPRPSWHWMTPKPQRKRKMMTQCHSSATQCHSAGSVSATARGGLLRPPGGTPWHSALLRAWRAGVAHTGYAILCGIGSHRMAMSYKLGVPGVSPLETHTATLSPVLGSVMTWGNPIILRSNGRLSGGVNSTIDKVRWPDVPIPEECLYSCAMLSNSSAG